MSRVATDLLGPVDAVRARLYRGLAPWLGWLAGDRAHRVRWSALLATAVAFATALIVPHWSLTWSPLVFGVPHLVAGVDLLVVRPGLHRLGWWTAAFAAPVVALSFGAPLWVGLVAVPVALTSTPTSPWRARAVIASWLAMSAVAWHAEALFQLAFVHVHNVVAVAMWWCWRPRSVRDSAILLALAVCSAGLLVGAFDVWLPWARLEAFATVLAPVDQLETWGRPVDAALPGRLTVLFAFWQSLHYAVWLRLLPDDARERPAPRPFAASARALLARWGGGALAASALVAIGLLGWGLVDVDAARSGYLQLAAFHGVLELAAAARRFSAKGAT